MREDLQWINDQETIELNNLFDEETDKLDAVYPYCIIGIPVGYPRKTDAQQAEHDRIEEEYKSKRQQIKAQYDELRKWTVGRGNTQLQ